MNSIDYPILEYDPGKKALIEPSTIIKEQQVPKVCLLPFYYDTIQQFRNEGILEEIAQIESSATPNICLYVLEFKGKKLAVISPGLGAPYAASILDVAIALGCRKFLAFGSCGVLDKSIKRNQLIIPSSAIRDEGTSYHYIPPSREVMADPVLVKEIEAFLDDRQIDNITGKTWTTDAFFRETPARIERRKKEGAIVVDMEAAALFAVSQFRDVKLGYILAGSDDVSGLEWDRRLHMKIANFHERFFWLAVEVALEIYKIRKK